MLSFKIASERLIRTIIPKIRPQDIGICLVTAFEGLVSRGRRQEVGETVRFLPELLYDAENALLIDGALGRGEVG